MMVYLDLNLAYLENLIGFTAGTLSDYRGMSVREVVDNETKAGNLNAAAFERALFNNPAELIKAFRLNDPSNIYQILHLFSPKELAELIPYLDVSVMQDSLNLLSIECMLKIMMKMSKENLAELTFKIFPPELFIQKTKESELNEFLLSLNIEKTDIIKSISGLDQKALCSAMETLTGIPVEHCNYLDVQNKLNSLNDTDFKKALRAFSPYVKGEMILQMTSETPKLLQEFSSEAMVSPFVELSREDFLSAMQLLKPEDLMSMMSEIPENILPEILSSINPEVFAHILMSDHKNLLSQIILN